MRRPAGDEPVRDTEDDVPARGAALEEAVAIAEAAVGRHERHDAPALAVQRAHRGERVAHLLAVGAHVLDRGGADQPGNPAQALEPGPVALHRVGTAAVPRLAPPARTPPP